MKFSKEDREQIEKKGITSEKVLEQLKIFERGNIPVNIEAAATAGNGITEISEEERKSLAQYYMEHKDNLEVLKFIPASGAATRMFKALHVFLDKFNPQKGSIAEYVSKANNPVLNRFFEQIEKLPFYKRAVSHAKESEPGFDSLNDEAKKFLLAQTILFSPGLNLSDFPKGLVPFHDYGSYVATAFEEHLYEAAAYAEVKGKAKLHFTVSKGHKEKFEAEFDKIKDRVEEKTKTEFEISYSYQDPKTDTVAATKDNQPFRTESGELFFRPGGHGALIENLNQQKADVVFIKNIDNVVTADNIKEVAEYKKMLAGKLLKLQEKSFDALKKLESSKPSEQEIQEIKSFIEEVLFTKLADGFESLSEEEKLKTIKERLNRPLRICGMVKNEGEPGGGPFLVNMEDGSRSLQIIEGAQIDDKNVQQKKIAQEATHFNPVDIVCGLKNYKGETFDLEKFVDPDTSFIAGKTKDGKALKALELPGLWNGAMAKWNTVFVEVPVSTFNPVKTVADLLKPSHQVNR